MVATPLRLDISYPAFQIFTFWFLTVAKLQLWSSKVAILQSWVSSTAWGNVLKCHRIRKAENHCPAEGLDCNAGFHMLRWVQSQKMEITSLWETPHRNKLWTKVRAGHEQQRQNNHHNKKKSQEAAPQSHYHAHHHLKASWLKLLC